MASKFLLAITAAAGLASAATSSSFRLSANVINYDLDTSVQGAELRVLGDACTSEMTFAASGETGSVFSTDNKGVFVNVPGSAAGLVVTPGGTATIPAANVVEGSCDKAASAISLAGGKAAFKDGVWMACPASVVNHEGDAVYLSYRESGQRTLAGCAEVELVAVCDSTASAVSGAVAAECQ